MGTNLTTAMIMKKILFFVIFIFASSVCYAEDVPIFGVWEQLVVAEANSNANPVRRNIVFSDKKITRETVFSALSDSFDGSLCCIKVKNIMSIDLSDLLEKYKWDSDDIDHLKSISGWNYIYEADLVDYSSQNKNMRDLVRDMSNPKDISPYYAAVVSGNPVRIKKNSSDFMLKGVIYKFHSDYDENGEIMRYVFNFPSGRVSFSERPFPAE
jgi:hypothetical protein